jgi:hypothetical protein
MDRLFWKLKHASFDYIRSSRNYILWSVNHTLRVVITQRHPYASENQTSACGNHTRAGEKHTLHVEMILSV